MESKEIQSGGFGACTQEQREREEKKRLERERKANEVEDKAVRGPKEQPKP